MASSSEVDIKAFSYDRKLLDDEVRILTVQPGEFGSAVYCTVSTETLANVLPYKALSYCWGEAALQDWIWLNEKRFDITRNVFGALQYLRMQKTPLRIWIDALCIHQDDIAEKNAQVQHMGQIYERASETIVWLGPSNPDFPDALDALVASSKKSPTSQLLLA